MPKFPHVPRKASGFSLAELLVVITIVVLMAVLTYAPYSYYGDLARVKSSAERLEQAFNEAKLETSMGLSVPGTEANADAYLVLEEGSGSVTVFAAKSQNGFANPASYVLLRQIPLESNVWLTGLPGRTVTVKYAAPKGTQSVQVSASAGSAPSALAGFSGASVGIRGASSGPLNKPFRAVSY